MTIEEIRKGAPVGANKYRVGWHTGEVLYYELPDGCDTPLFIGKDGSRKPSYSMDVLVELKPL